MLRDEDAVKKALGISSFRELSKDKMLAFAAAMPDMATEVRLKLIEQLPAFQKFALDAVNAIERTFERTSQSNDESERRVHDALDDVRDALKTELRRDDISEAHREAIYEKLSASAEASSRKDTESKRFKSDLAGGVQRAIVTASGIAAVTALVLAGGKIMVSRDGGPAD